jgi:hypothetical protein
MTTLFLIWLTGWVCATILLNAWDKDTGDMKPIRTAIYAIIWPWILFKAIDFILNDR